MAEYRTDLRSWIEVYDYLIREYKNRESKYLGEKVAKPNVVVPKDNVGDARSKGYFEATNRSFDLGAEYNLRHESYMCSLQVRKYNDGEHLYNAVDSDRNILLGTNISKEVLDANRDLYYVEVDWKNPEATAHSDVQKSVRALIGHLFLDVIGYNPGGYFTQHCSENIRNKQ